jgi:16S rRNA (uracil1498-N3)-methyltransferase
MRFHLPPDRWTGETLDLDTAESHHAAVVLRAAVGDRATLFDGAGRVAEVEIIGVSKSKVSVRVIKTQQLPARDIRLALAVAVPKGQNIEWIIEKAVELGASEVVPMLTERTVVRVAATDRAERRRKFERTAIEACKQCGQNWLPVLHGPTPFSEAIRALSAETDLPLVASLEPQSRPLRELVGDFAQANGRAPRSAAILIGPEGDLTASEYAEARVAGFRPMSLGPIVLRVETAALAALSIVGYELGRKHH